MFLVSKEYNEYLRIELDKFNAKPFQKKEGSRLSHFLALEQATLTPLPQYPFEYCEYKEAKVQNNSHISLNKHYYSVHIDTLVKKCF